MTNPLIFLVTSSNWNEFDSIIAQPQRKEIRSGDEIFFLLKDTQDNEVMLKLKNLALDWAKWQSSYNNDTKVITMRRIS